MKSIRFEDLTKDQRRELVSWLADSLAEMEPDEEFIAEHRSEDLVPAIRGLLDFLRCQNKKR